MGREKVNRTFAYGDPSALCDTLRKLEKKIDNCGQCHHDGGTAWGRRLCGLGKRPDRDGYCGAWQQKAA